MSGPADPPFSTATARMREAGVPPQALLGCNEWLGLPGLGIPAIDAKIDTGAESSVLHAENIRVFRRGGARWVRFVCRPEIGLDSPWVECRAPVADRRQVRSSNGVVQTRWFIRQEISGGPDGWVIDLSLTDRRRMRHRMLIGRGALAGVFLVDPGRSYLLGPR